MLGLIKMVLSGYKETKKDLVFYPTVGMGQHYMDTSAPPIFALELTEAIVHIEVK